MNLNQVTFNPPPPSREAIAEWRSQTGRGGYKPQSTGRRGRPARSKGEVYQKRLERWRKNPLRFFTEALDCQDRHLWPKMYEIAEAVRDYPQVAVGAGHGVSKTYTAARLALWFLYCHAPATVITTAPTYKQVEELLWREIRQAHQSAKEPLGGKITQTRLDLQPETGKKWFALGFATRADTVTLEATAFQGYHNENVMVIFDEAAGILPQIWKAANHLLTSGLTRWLVIGNLTSAQGNFADCFRPDSGWKQIHISVKDTPNYLYQKDVIPGVSGVAYEQQICKKYGETSNEYKIRILGQLPDYTESTYFGKQLAEARANGQFGFFPAEAGAKVYTVWDIGDTHTVIWFVQFIKESIRLIDFFYDSGGQGLPAYAALLQQKGYVYAQHFAPWDVGGADSRDKVGPNAKNFQTGKYTTDIAKDLGVGFTVLGKYARVDQISAAQDIIRLCQFHLPPVQEGLEGLHDYRKKLNQALSTDSKPVYYDEPVKDWSEHVGSAFCGLAMAYRYELRIDGCRIGHPGPLRNEGYDEIYRKQGDYDPLRWGLTR